jgi:hypothetical protein
MAGTGLDMRYDAEAEFAIAPFTVGGGYAADLQGTRARPTGSLYLSPSLREVSAVTDAVREATGRSSTHDVVIPRSGLYALISRYLDSGPLAAVQVRPVGTALVLPLERETVYLLSTSNPEVEEPWLPVEVQRSSSSVRVFTPGGADTGARIITIRPRPLTDWLVRARAVSDGRFADGSVLLGLLWQPRADGDLDLTLYWQVPTTANGGALGARAQLLVDGAVPRAREQFTMPFRHGLSMPAASAPFPAIQARRPDELIVQVVRLDLDSNRLKMPDLRVALLDDRDQPIRTATGDANLAIP